MVVTEGVYIFYFNTVL